jgi:5-hydroxyisourate hydrolase-like protein (transthyretin family)
MNETRSRVTTHVLDAGLGRPAQGVPARLEQRVGHGWSAVAEGSTTRTADSATSARPILTTVSIG